MGINEKQEIKFCKTCTQPFPKTNEYFSYLMNDKNKLNDNCRKCYKKVSDKKYYDANKEKFSQTSKEYYINHKDDYVRRKEKNKEKISINMKIWRNKNKEYLREKQQQYKKENEARIKETQKRYYQANKYELSQKKLEYTRKNKDKVKIWNQTRRTLKKETVANLTNEQWESIKIKFKNKCAYCGEEKQLTIDHFIPLSILGELSSNNVVPACQSCNSSKRNYMFDEWYPKQSFYSKKREKLILKYLNYKNNKQQLKMFNEVM